MGYEPDLDHPYRNRPYHNEAEKDAWLKRLQEADAARARIAKTRERRARRRRGKLTTKPGNYVRGDSVYASHFSRTQPTVHVTKEWAIELTARCLGLDEERFRNSLNRGRRRPKKINLPAPHRTPHQGSFSFLIQIVNQVEWARYFSFAARA
jgi:hypothetical protein